MRQRKRREARQAQYDDEVYCDLLRRLSAKLRWLRALREWSQAEAAHRCGMATSQFQFVERGETNVTATTLARLARGFSVDVCDLLTRLPPQEKESDP